ncbi:MAG: Uma2 family endonuclease [Bacteroidia bacterium]
MGVLKIDWVSPQEYLAYEDSIEGRAEYYNGVIVDMAGGSENHSLITMNIGGLLFGALRGSPCRVYDCNFKVELSEDSVYGYPDVLVICGETQKAKLRGDICKNPTIVVEVLSEGTRHRDQGLKHFYYRQIPSLQEFITIEQNYPFVTVHWRNSNDQWVIDLYASIDDHVRIPSLGLSIAMKDIYANAELSDPPKLDGLR